MRDFSLELYSKFLSTIKNNYQNIIVFSDYLSQNRKCGRFILIRHDVDRKEKNALKMADLEHSFGIKASYYFRVGRSGFDKNVIKKIADYGHELGYHYEDLVSCGGDYIKALKSFKIHLKQLREITQIRTVCMHGSPFSKYDNKNLWQNKKNRNEFRELGMLGELYLDINYSDICYLSDTGRNWKSKFNIRDRVLSNYNPQIQNTFELIDLIKSKKYAKICIQIHPERWTDNFGEWYYQMIKDFLINYAKTIKKSINK